MKVKKRFATLCAAAIIAVQPTMAFAALTNDYTPVMPRVSGYPGLNDAGGLEEYTGEQSLNTNIYDEVIRDDTWTGNDANNVNTNSGTTRMSNSFIRMLAPVDDNTTNNTDNTNSNADNTNSNENGTVNDNANNTADNSSLNNTTNNDTINNDTLNNLNTNTTVYTKPSIVSSINEVDNIKVNGELPQIMNLSNLDFTNRMNQKIRDAYTTIVSAGYENITTKYDVYNFANITSIVVRFNVSGARTANAREIVKTFVFDSASQNEVTLKQLLGDDYIEFVSTHIANQIAANQSLYYTDSNRFQTIKTNESFYVTSGQINIIFDEYAIAPGSTGTPMFTIPYDNSITIKLGTREYFTDKGMNFISLSTVLRLGMDIRLVTGGAIDIISPNGHVLASINPNAQKGIESNDIRLINGYDVAISTEFAKVNLGVSIETTQNSNELTLIATY